MYLWFVAMDESLVIQFFVAGPELVPRPFVVRVSDWLLTRTVVLAVTVVVPAVFDVIATVHEPVVPTVVQLSVPLTNVAVAPPVFWSPNVISVPCGALTHPAPVPWSTLTWPVSVWFVPTGLSAVGGLIEMLASTNVFVLS